MRKFIWISIVFLILGCGSRKKEVYKDDSKTDLSTTTTSNVSKNLESSNESKTYLSTFLHDKNLKIISDGKPYHLQYGDLLFSGSASIDFSEKKEETIYHHINVVNTIYQTHTDYQTKTTYKTERSIKHSNVERKGISFGGIIWIVIISAIGGVVLWSIMKKYTPVLFKNILKLLKNK